MDQHHCLRRRCFLPKRRPDWTAPDAADAPTETGLSLTPRITLRERLLSLAGVRGGETSSDRLNTTTYFIDAGVTPHVLCRCHDEGIQLGPVSAEDRAEILRSGWGQQLGESILIYPPRDWIETEIIWRTVVMAYRHLTTVSLHRPKTHDVSIQQSESVLFTTHSDQLGSNSDAFTR